VGDYLAEHPKVLEQVREGVLAAMLDRGKNPKVKLEEVADEAG
jgi:hypothetical protein